MKILVVDDDPGVRESLRRSLTFNGYTVELATDGVQGLRAFAARKPDAVVLDVMMPHLDGLETCRQLRSTGDDTPILMLTAREAVSDRVAGLDAGADDYLAKPFALEELLARLRALLRRALPVGSDGGDLLKFADLSLDPATRDVRGAIGRSASPAPSSCCSSCCCVIRGRSWSGRRSWSRSGVTTSRPRPTPWRSTSATCGARPRPTASPG